MDWFQQTLKKLNSIVESQAGIHQWWLGLSGGVDSIVLLELLCQLKQHQPDLKLAAIHVNHSISSNANAWAEFCKKRCHDYGIDYVERTIQVGNETRQGTEKPLREARWHVFTDILTHFAQSTDGTVQSKSVLCLAHHQDDQVETLLLNLLRGAGTEGASGMSEWEERTNFYLARPFLDVNKQALFEYAQQNDLTWVEDESNEQVKYRRNFLRHRVMPVLAEQWPNYRQTLSRFTRNMKVTEQLTHELAKIDLQATGSGEGLDILVFSRLANERQLNLLRYWLRQSQSYSPGEVQLNEILQQIKQYKSDSQLQFELHDKLLTVHQGQLLLLPKHHLKSQPFELQWNDFSEDLPIPELNKVLTVEEGGELRAPKADETVIVRSRRGGEQCWPLMRDKRTSLKKVFQELGVARWEREKVPLVFYNDVLVCAVEKFICKEALAKKGDKGIRFNLI